jgi:hypothetical protein
MNVLLGKASLHEYETFNKKKGKHIKNQVSMDSRN